LGSVNEQSKASLGAHWQQGFVIRGVTEEVNGYRRYQAQLSDLARVQRNCTKGERTHRSGICRDIDEYRLGADQPHGSSRGRKAERRNKDGVPVTHPQAAQSENESVGAAAAGDDLDSSNVAGQTLFEFHDLWTVKVLPVSPDGFKSLLEWLLNSLTLRL
jgi:hypothetical protein